MTFTTVSSTELARYPGRVVKATSGGPVSITERGKQSHVLLTFEEYQRIMNAKLDTQTASDKKVD